MSMEKSTKPAGDKDAADKAAARRERREKKSQQETRVSDFVLAMHRLNNATADADVFSKNGVTIAEWALLKEMNGKDEVSLADVNKAARISRQRLRTLLSELDEKGFIKVAKSETGEGDQRTRTITVLPKTGETIAAVERDFDALSEKVAPLGMAVASNRLGGWTRIMGKLANALRRSEVAEARSSENKSVSAEKRAEARAARKNDPERAAAKQKREEERKSKKATKDRAA